MNNSLAVDSLSQSTSVSKYDLIRLSIEGNSSIDLFVNLYLLIALVIFILLISIVKVKFPAIWAPLTLKGGYKITFKVPGLEFEKTIERNFNNVFIANRIYIELNTRKAAIDIDETQDIIVEVYDSWYSLFSIIREEIKNIPGELLRNNPSTDNLIEITTKILNKGLRPHLTIYQAKFRRWYEHAITKEENIHNPPQKIQSEFEDFDVLVTDMKHVSALLIEYSDELKRFISGG